MLGLSFVFVCAAIVLAVCMVLVFHKEYEDGAIGRIALSIIGVAAFGRMAGILDNPHLPVTGVAMMLWLGVAIFLVRHFYRFMQWHTKGDHEWRATDTRQTPGK